QFAVVRTAVTAPSSTVRVTVVLLLLISISSAARWAAVVSRGLQIPDRLPEEQVHLAQRGVRVACGGRRAGTEGDGVRRAFDIGEGLPSASVMRVRRLQYRVRDRFQG